MNSNNTMDIFCGSTFWDSNLTWHTEDPELTPCFEKTVLVWTPCAFLWVLTLLEIYYIINSKERNIPRNLIGLSKLVFTILLIVVTLVDLGLSLHKAAQGESVYDVDYYTPIIKIATFILILNLLYYNKRYGIRVSGVQFFFWLLFLVASLPQLRREIVAHRESDNVYGFSSHLTLCLLVFINFLLNCFAEPAPKRTPYSDKKNPCPEVSSSFPSRLTYSWFDPLAMTGFRRPLVESDLWALNPEDSSAEAVPRFDKFWQKTLNKMENTNSPKASFRKASGSIDLGSAKDKKPASILPALCFAFGGQFIFGSFLKLINDVMMFLSPQLLRLLISFVEGGESLWKGYLYAVLLFMTATVQTMLLAHYFTRMYLVGMKIRTALTSAIYRKALKMSNASRKESTVGEIVNLMSVDAQRFLELTAYLNMIWSAPLQIFLALYFLWDLLGPSVLAGLAVMIVLIPVNGVIANRVKVLQIKQMKYKDERVKLMNEVLNGIKVLKMYAWEPSFEEQILKIRNKELHVLKQAAYLNSATSFIWSCAPFLVTFLTFATYVLSSPDNVLTPQKAFVALSLFLIMHLPLGLLPLVVVSVVEVSLVSFACFVLISDENVLDSKIAFVSLSLFNILRFPLSMLPMVISNIIQTSVAIKRLNKFMNCEELDQGSVSHDTSEANPIVIENGTFSWGEGEPTLKNINVSIPAGSLIAVVGTVGSGKSSLLSTFLGDMNKVSGRVNTVGSIAYVPQQAWIQNATLQDNILFGKSVDKARYKTVVDACALTPDLKMLPGGDQTEIGEKGINLSGGQKQRVSLARAVYYDTDIYFLDDPLSAVDSHVGKHIFEQVIGPSGLLKNKTRVLVTHGITYLPQADSIIVLKNGEVSESGTYQQLLDKKGAFADFLLQHISEPGLQEESDINEIKQQLESKLGQEFQNKLQRARSLSESASESEQRSLSGERSVSVKRRSPEKTPDSIAMQKANNKLIEVEKTETGSVKWSVYKHYLISVGIVAAIVTIFMNLILQMFQIGSNYWLSLWAVDSNMVVNGTVNTQMRDMYLGVYGVLGLGQAFASFFADLMPYLGFWKAAKIMHAHLLNGILKCPLYFFETTPLGRVLARFSKDVDVLDTSLPQQIADCVFCVFEVVATLFVISKATPIFMAVILPVGILYYFIQRFYVATSRQLKRLESVSRSPIYSHFGETVTGAQTIRAYGVSERFILESESRVDHNQACYYPSCIANRWLAVRLEMIGNLIIFFAALFTVLGRYTINAGLVGLSVSYALQITQTLNWLVRMTSEVETNIVAVERIKEYAETQQEAAWESDAGALPATWPHAGAVQLDSLVLTYGRGGTGGGGSETEPALKGVTCHIRAGEKIGIVGRTGAGKSTLTLGLFRIIEAAGGRILVDDVDISKIGLHQLRSRITIIPQDPVLFSGSLRMNLDPFNVYTDEELWRVLDLAHLKAFVKGLAAGLEHAVSEGGENLSVGQRQLVCLARALLRKTPLLVLDEATAAVDLETDDLIQRTIRQEFASCTILTIAHRLNTIMDSSRVMVLDKGRLVEFAAPAELLQDKNTIFYSMAKDAGLVN